MFWSLNCPSVGQKNLRLLSLTLNAYGGSHCRWFTIDLINLFSLNHLIFLLKIQPLDHHHQKYFQLSSSSFLIHFIIFITIFIPSSTTTHNLITKIPFIFTNIHKKKSKNKIKTLHQLNTINNNKHYQQLQAHIFKSLSLFQEIPIFKVSTSK